MLSITFILIIVTALISFTAFRNQELFNKLKFNPYMVYHRKEWYRIVSHAFVHGDWMHLFVNMWVLLIFGRNVEPIFIDKMGYTGMFLFVLLYFGGVFFAALPGIGKHKDNHIYSSVGASGAVSAVLFAGIVLDPLSGIGLLIFPRDWSIPAYLFGILYLFYEYYMDKYSKDNVAHDAHYWGSLFGVVYTALVIPDAISNFVILITDF